MFNEVMSELPQHDMEEGIQMHQTYGQLEWIHHMQSTHLFTNYILLEDLQTFPALRC